MSQESLTQKMTKEEAEKQYEQGQKIMEKAQRLLAKAKTQKEKDAANALYCSGYEPAEEARLAILAINEAIYREKYPPLPQGAITFTGFIISDVVDWKRFSIEGIALSATCPTCGGKIETICGEYLSYPEIGKPIQFKVWCEGCCKAAEETQGYEGHEATATIVIRLE